MPGLWLVLLLQELFARRREDAFKTSVYQDFYKLGYFKAFMYLFPNGDQKEMNIISKNSESIINDAISMVQEKLSSRVHEFYRERVKVREENAVKVLKLHLKKIHKPSKGLLVQISGLLTLNNPKIKQTVTSALLSSLNRLRAGPKQIKNILNAIKRKNKDNKEIMIFSGKAQQRMTDHK